MLRALAFVTLVSVLKVVTCDNTDGMEIQLTRHNTYDCSVSDPESTTYKFNECMSYKNGPYYDKGDYMDKEWNTYYKYVLRTVYKSNDRSCT